MSEPLFFTKRQAAEQLCMSVGTLDQYITRGDLKVRRMGARVFIPQAELLRFASRDHVKPAWPPKEKRPDGTYKTVRKSLQVSQQ